jgi:ribosomal protein S18 acetylase RimI-like enzyme
VTGWTIRPGFDEAARGRVAQLYWAAFGGKLGRVMGPEARALAFVARVADPAHALSAVAADGRLLGIVGFKTARGAFVGGELADLAAVYGRLGGLWRLAALSLLERDTENRRFLMDGICVAACQRGRGIGSALLDAVAAEAASRGYGELRLDVVDGNPRARALYERRGFRAVGHARIGLAGRIYGIAGVTTMVREVARPLSRTSP